MSPLPSTVMCDNTWITIFTVICFVITLLITWLCAMYLMHNLWYQQKICGSGSDETNVYKQVKLFCVVTEMQCGLSQIALIILTYFFHKECVKESANIDSMDRFSVEITTTTFLGMYMYTFSLTCVYVVFASRVVAAFHGSIWQLSKNKIIVLKLVSIIQFCCNLASPTLYFFDRTMSLIFMALSLVE